MSAIGSKLRLTTGTERKMLMHWCPGCDEPHGVTIQGGPPQWTFNGNYDKPTFTPSVLCFTTNKQGQRETLCHYFITNGQIQFCGDSPHALAGKTVDLPDWPYAKGEFGGIED